MIEQKYTNYLIIALVVAALGITGYLYYLNYNREHQSQAGAYASYFEDSQIMEINIKVDQADWDQMIENAQDEEYLAVDMDINGTSISSVGIRPKGNSSLQMAAQGNPDDRVSFKVEFDHYIAGQTLAGLDKMVLNNMISDATSLKEYFSFDLMRFMGIDTPYFSYANIYINGQYWGIYFALEAYDDSYAQRVFGNDHGQLYNVKMSLGQGGGERGNPQEKQAPEELDQTNPPEGFDPEAAFNSAGRPNSDGGFDRKGGGFGGFGGGQSNGGDLVYTDDKPDSYSEILDNAVFDTDQGQETRLIKALKALNEGENLESYFEVDEILRYLAAHTFVANFDSYISNMHQNYYLYEEDGQIAILPWDYNLAYGGMGSGASEAVNFPLDTPVQGVEMSDRPLVSQLLAVPEYQELYHQYWQEMLQDYFQSGYFASQVAKIDALISPYLEIDPTAFYTYAEHQTAVKAFLEFNELRVQSTQGQLDGTIPSTTEGQEANPAALVDCSQLNLSDLGSQGGGMGGFGGGQPPGGQFNSSGAGRPGNFPDMEGNSSGAGFNSSGRDNFAPPNLPGNRTEQNSTSSNWLVGLIGLGIIVVTLLLVFRFKRRK